MRYINMDRWPRLKHFSLFNSFNHPHFSMCANVDLTEFHLFVRKHGYSFTVAVTYLIARAANAITEFRYRIRGERVVEHEKVNPSFTILVDGEIFSFCLVEYIQDFDKFSDCAADRIRVVRKLPVLENDPLNDDVLYMTPIPWVSFTSFEHAMQFHPVDSVPRFAWGKYFEENGRLKMPLSVQVHHAVVDGLQVGMFYEEIKAILEQPDKIIP